jgi:hypothetical protein
MIRAVNHILPVETFESVGGCVPSRMARSLFKPKRRQQIIKTVVDKADNET